MSQPLPSRPSLEWLKKFCKERLAALRADNPQAKLADVQLSVAREYGFSSWRKLKSHVEHVRDANEEPPAEPIVPPASATVPPDDLELATLLAAIHAGELQVVAELLNRRPALAAARGPDGQMPLHAAAYCNDARLGVLLIAHGADPQSKYGESGHTALSWAATCGSVEFAQTLVRMGYRPDLFCAAGIGAFEAVRAWFDESGSLLTGASQTGSSRMAPDGTRLPCPPHEPIEQVSDALYIASRNAQVEVVAFLLTKKPDLSFRAYMGGTALHWAHFGGSRAVIEQLERAGADPDARDDTLHCTPRSFGICVPANWGILEMVQWRLAEYSNLANPVDEPTSPLHQAAHGGHAEIVRLLLDAGTDPSRSDGDGKTALELAAARGHDAVVAVLRR